MSNGALLFLFLVGFGSASYAQATHSAVSNADQEYAAIFAHPANPCPNATNTVSYNQCIRKELDSTEQHLKAFVAAVRAIAAKDDTAPPPSAGYGPRREVQYLDAADTAWRDYRKNLCGLQSAGMAGGTGQPGSEMDCLYRVDRDYVRQLADAVALKTLAK